MNGPKKLIFVPVTLNLFGPFVSYEENEVLRIPQISSMPSHGLTLMSSVTKKFFCNIETWMASLSLDVYFSRIWKRTKRLFNN